MALSGAVKVKQLTQFECVECGTTSSKWQGQCDACGEWNSLVEQKLNPQRGNRRRSNLSGPGMSSMAVPLNGIDQVEAECRSTKMPEFDRVLGGGIIAGSLVLLGGDPGIGKSTLALQIAAHVGHIDKPVLYVSGEESMAQLGLRAQRIDCTLPVINVLAEVELEQVLTAITAHAPPLVIIDSVQTLFDPAMVGAPGSVAQVREAVMRLMLLAKQTAIPMVLVGHVTKDGAIAGPKTLEHMVDVVLYLEGEPRGEHRLLRCVKNRFGATGEVGLFDMKANGLQQLTAPGRAFLNQGSMGISGTTLTVTCEGSRPLLVEVQALAAPTPFGLPRRTPSGIDAARLHLLLAVLEKRGRVTSAQSDVYVNAVGGVRLTEPAVDLAVALAIASSVRDKAMPENWVALGELGLGGEVRRVRRLEARLQEAAVLGMTDAIIPAGQNPAVGAGKRQSGLRVHPVASIKEALELVLS